MLHSPSLCDPSLESHLTDPALLLGFPCLEWGEGETPALDQGRREAENPYPGSRRESFELLECCQEPRPECHLHSTDGRQKPGTW